MRHVQRVGGVVAGKPETRDILEHGIVADHHDTGIVGHAAVRQRCHERLHSRLDHGASQQPVILCPRHWIVDLCPNLRHGEEVACDIVCREQLPREIVEANGFAPAGGGQCGHGGGGTGRGQAEAEPPADGRQQERPQPAFPDTRDPAHAAERRSEDGGGQGQKTEKKAAGSKRAGRAFSRPARFAFSCFTQANSSGWGSISSPSCSRGGHACRHRCRSCCPSSHSRCWPGPALRRTCGPACTPTS